MGIRTSKRQDITTAQDAVSDAFAARPTQPIRLRLQPAIFWPDGARGQYRSWPTVHWTVECDTVQEAMAIRKALQQFFDRLDLDGPEAVEDSLKQAVA